jgi:hypothetical protein
VTTRVTTSEENLQSPAVRFLDAVRLADVAVLPAIIVNSCGIADIELGDLPKWVIRCGEKVSCSLMPRIQQGSNFAAKGNHYKAGFALGMIETGLKMAADLFKKLKPWPAMPELTKEEIRKGLRRYFGALGDSILETGGNNGTGLEKDVEEFESKMDLAQSAEFAQGAADAKAMLAGKNKSNDATRIYLCMLVFWRVVDRLESVDQLFEMLTKIFGRNLVGSDPKRISQICLRVGKKFRVRGRPRKQLQ